MPFQRRLPPPSVDAGSPAYMVVHTFGGLPEFCRISEFKRSTVYDWMKKGLIPARHQPTILELSRAHRKGLKAGDLVAVPVKGQ